MNKKHHSCQFCGGTIGQTEKIERLIPTSENKDRKYVEVWFDCIYCKSEYDPSKTLVDVLID